MADEEQAEELEGLEAIFEDGPELNVVCKEYPNVELHLKVIEEEDGDLGPRTCTLGVKLPAEYPNELPKLWIVDDAGALNDGVKEAAVAAVMEEAEGLLGMPMLYSLVEHLRSSLDDVGIPRELNAKERAEAEAIEAERKRVAGLSLYEQMKESGDGGEARARKKKEKKKADEAGAGGGTGAPPRAGTSKRKQKKLTKAEKQALLRRGIGAGSEDQRGYGWVDLVTHLRKTGSHAS